MAGNAMETVVLVGVLGAGGYLAYEYYQYSSAMNTVASANGVTAASLESILSFFTWIGFNWGGSSSGTAQQQQLYTEMQAALSGSTAAAPTPGTTSPSQPTSVSTAPTTTSTGVRVSTAPTTVGVLVPDRAQPSGFVIGSSRLPSTALSVRAGAARTANALTSGRSTAGSGGGRTQK